VLLVEEITPDAEDIEEPEEMVETLVKEEVPSEAQQQAGRMPPPTRDPETVVARQDLFDACKADFGMSATQVTKELTQAFPNGLPGTYSECYAKIVELRCSK